MRYCLKVSLPEADPSMARPGVGETHPASQPAVWRHIAGSARHPPHRCWVTPSGRWRYSSTVLHWATRGLSLSIDGESALSLPLTDRLAGFAGLHERAALNRDDHHRRTHGTDFRSIVEHSARWLPVAWLRCVTVRVRQKVEHCCAAADVSDGDMDSMPDRGHIADDRSDLGRSSRKTKRPGLSRTGPRRRKRQSVVTTTAFESQDNALHTTV
jgi:hypothetical protein